MNISYQHANPFTGRESVVLRIDGLLSDQTVCILIDAGEGVAIDELLDEDEDEYLTAVCLTHAHLDHYKTLGENLCDGAPIYAAPDTAAILEDVINAGPEVDQQTTETITDRLVPVDEWTSIVDGLRVRPVPAGHTPGAAGMLLSVEDDTEQRTILATGDFTTRRAAGYPGFETDLPIDIDVLLLNAAASTNVETKLTETVTRLIDRALAGSTVLATASGLTGLHLAYLLGHIAARYDTSVSVTLAGHAAILADRLDYDIPYVSTHPEFTDPASVLDSGCITIAGPEVPSRDGSKSADRLFTAIDDDPGATLVQVLSGSESPIRTAGCTIHDEFLSNHPTRETIDALVDQLMPVHVVIMHQKGSAADRYKDKFASYVWVTDDQTRHTLLDDRGWTPPPWVSAMTRQRVEQSSTKTSRYIGDEFGDDDGLLFPSISRLNDVDLAAEGLDVEAVIQHVPTITTHPSPSSTQADSSYSPAHDGTETETETEAEATPTAHEKPDAEQTEEESIPTNASLERILDRLDRLEGTMRERRYPARVLDSRDGTTILRIDETLPEIDTGDTVYVQTNTGDE